MLRRLYSKKSENLTFEDKLLAKNDMHDSMTDPAGIGLQVEGYSLWDFPAVVRALGADPQAIARRCNYRLENLEQPGGTIEYTTYCQLLEEAALQTGIEHFGLMFGKGHSVEVLGWMSELGSEYRTMGERTRIFIRHFNMVSRGELLHLARWGETPVFVRTPIVARFAHSTQAQDVTIMETVQVFRTLLGSRWNPQAVYLTHRPADTAPYHEALRCPVHFDAQVQAIALSDSDLATPVQQATVSNAAALPQRESSVQGTLDAWRKSWSDQVRGAIQLDLAEGHCSVGTVARRLNLHTRTLHRRLRAEDTSFSTLFEETRRELAAYLVGSTPLSIVEVGDLLGYSDATAFSRSFRRWFGSAPSRWRKAQADHPADQSPFSVSA